MNIDNKGAKEIAEDEMEENEVEEMKIATNLNPYTLSRPCQLLLEKLENCTPSPIVLRKIIRKSVLSDDEIFDVTTHEDLNFVEVLGTHL